MSERPSACSIVGAATETSHASGVAPYSDLARPSSPLGSTPWREATPGPGDTRSREVSGSLRRSASTKTTRSAVGDVSGHRDVELVGRDELHSQKSSPAGPANVVEMLEHTVRDAVVAAGDVADADDA